MTDTKEIILKLKEIKLSKNLSLNDIVDLTGGMVSKTTVQRVFADGSEEISFRYDETIRPIANALLDIENIEDTDNMDVQAMKILLKYKIQKIEELEEQIKELKSAFANEKLKYHEKLDSEREQYFRRIDFLKEQVALKDKRMDLLLEAVFQKDKAQKELMEKILHCPCRKGD